jgi:hypothetical protein
MMKTRLRLNLSYSLVSLSAIVLAACQTDRAGGKSDLSLDRAKLLTTTIETQVFVAPPRTIGNIDVRIGELPITPTADLRGSVRPTMQLVAIKSEEQQGVLMLHRTREFLDRQRTMLVNAIRAI